MFLNKAAESMKLLLVICTLCCIMCGVSGYWDTGTTTLGVIRTDTGPRQSFFRWQWIASTYMRWFWYWYDWDEIDRRRRLVVVAGISIDFLCLGTAAILNRRTLITSANYLDPWANRPRDLRIWALGRTGVENTPYRYRVWRLTRLYPKSLNPEHWHGPRGIHSPRHDVTIIHSLDMIYIMSYKPWRYLYPYRTFVTPSHKALGSTLWFSGSGFEYLQHIAENYKIYYSDTKKEFIVDCSIYVPKWWGKFICIRNHHSFPGIQNGGGLFDDNTIVGLGCFEIRYNEDRIFVFTDLRYYIYNIYHYAWIWNGQYYEYAYPQWGVKLGWFIDGGGNYPYIPWHQVQTDMYPLGKK